MSYSDGHRDGPNPPNDQQVAVGAIMRVFWLRSKVQRVTLGEAMQLVALLAVSLVIPLILFPTFGVVLIYLLDRMGLTLAGKGVVIVALAVLLRLSWELSLKHSG